MFAQLSLKSKNIKCGDKTSFKNYIKELGEAFSQRRKCVIRMTVATTLSHLLLEGPACSYCITNICCPDQAMQVITQSCVCSIMGITRCRC
uniref:Uncharacterized protein n=1 Tax=Parascaris equorum TaxID=6256 RepID=A0A914RZS1_PAREQ